MGNLCNGCSRLEEPYFMGQAKCGYAVDPIEKIHRILGIQEKLKL